MFQVLSSGVRNPLSVLSQVTLFRHGWPDPREVAIFLNTNPHAGDPGKDLPAVTVAELLTMPSRAGVAFQKWESAEAYMDFYAWKVVEDDERTLVECRPEFLVCAGLLLAVTALHTASFLPPAGSLLLARVFRFGFLRPETFNRTLRSVTVSTTHFWRSGALCDSGSSFTSL